MKKFIQSMIVILGMLATVVPPGNLAEATDGTWSRDENLMFIPTWIDPVNGYLDGAINYNGRFDIGVKEFCVFTYDLEQVSQAQAEADIENYQAADWVRGADCRTYTPEHTHTISISSVVPDKILLNNRSGVFYYVLKLERWDAEGTDWVWGKVDHHYYSYDSNTDPHLSVRSYWGGDVKTGTFRMIRVEADDPVDYIAWADEWRQDLMGRIGGFETEIEAWAGDEVQKDDLLHRLETAKNIAADASEAEALQTQFQELLDRFRQKIIDLTPSEPENPDQPVIPDTPVKPEEPKEEEDEQKPGSGDNSGSSMITPSRPSGSGSNGSSDSNGGTSDKIESITEDVVAVVQPNPAQPTNSANNSTSVDIISGNSGQNAAKTDQRSENTVDLATNSTAEGENSEISTEDNQNTENNENDVEIPALRGENSEKNHQNWLFWLIIAIILAVAAGLWWCKRAFWSNKTSKYNK